jgi:hypothetical protein
MQEMQQQQQQQEEEEQEKEDQDVRWPFSCLHEADCIIHSPSHKHKSPGDVSLFS